MIVAFCVNSAALIRMIPYVSALKYGVVITAPPRYTTSMLFVPLFGGAVVKIICPLITEYESVFCFTPSMNTRTDASLPYSYARLKVVVELLPVKNSDLIAPLAGWLPRYPILVHLYSVMFYLW